MRNLSSDSRLEAGETMRVQTVPPLSHQQTSSTAAAKKIAILGPTLRFKGELSAEEDFVLQGRIEGSINHTQSVTIGSEGSVLGNIHARKVTVEGSVEGDLHGTESVIVSETARVTGNIYAPRVGIVEGALFSGRVEMVRAAESSRATEDQRREIAPGVPMTAEATERLLVGR